MMRLRILAALACVLLMAACGGDETTTTQASDLAANAADVDISVDSAPAADETDDDAEVAEAIEETMTDILGGTSEDGIDSESDAVMATVEASIDAREDAAQNDANTGGDASDERDAPTIIEPGSYSGAATFGVDDLSLDMRDVYRVNASVNDVVLVTVTNTQPEDGGVFTLFTDAGFRTSSDFVEAGMSETMRVGMTSDGFVALEANLTSYEFSIALEARNDGDGAGDASNDPASANPMPSGDAVGVLGVPAADGTPDRDCYAHGGAAITFSATEGQERRRPRITAQSYDADGNELAQRLAQYGTTDVHMLASDVAATAVCFTASLNGGADLLYAEYTFVAGEGPDFAAAEAEVIRAAFDGCALLSAETILTTLGVESATETELDSGSGSCTLSLVDVGIIFGFNIATDSDFAMLDLVGETTPIDGLGDDALYANLNGQGLVQWQVDGVTYQLLAFDFVNGTVSAETLTQVAQTIQIPANQ